MNTNAKLMKPSLDLLQACQQIQQKQLKVDDYLAQCTARAEQVEPELKAFTARASLQELQRQSGTGPLMGIPVAVKDIIATKDFVTSNG